MKIINSTAMKESVESITHNTNIKLLNNQGLLSEIIDNINYFLYDSNFSG